MSLKILASCYKPFSFYGLLKLVPIQTLLPHFGVLPTILMISNTWFMNETWIERGMVSLWIVIKLTYFMNTRWANISRCKLFFQTGDCHLILKIYLNAITKIRNYKQLNICWDCRPTMFYTHGFRVGLFFKRIFIKILRSVNDFQKTLVLFANKNP